jgi:hypothetical protein
VEAHPPPSSPHSPSNVTAATHTRLLSQFVCDMMISVNIAVLSACENEAAKKMPSFSEEGEKGRKYIDMRRVHGLL